MRFNISSCPSASSQVQRLPKLLLFIIYHQELFVPLKWQLELSSFSQKLPGKAAATPPLSKLLRTFLALHPSSPGLQCFPARSSTTHLATERHTHYTPGVLPHITCIFDFLLPKQADGHSTKSPEHTHACRNTPQAEDRSLRAAAGQSII